MARALDHHLHVVLPGDARQFAQRLQLGELGGIVGIGDRAGTQAVTERERHIVGLHDVADVGEVRVEEALLVMRQTPLGHDRAATRDDAGHPVRGQRHPGQAYAGMDGEIVHALLRLLDQRVAEDLPGQVLGAAIDLFQRLVDRHGADRHRRIAQDPFARLVDVLAGGQIHQRVAAPAHRPHHFLDFLGDRGRHGGIADIGVDLHQEIAADDHRLQFRVVDVGGDDGATARHLVADELRRHALGHTGAETDTAVLFQQAALAQLVQAQVLADGDEFHFRRDDALARVVHLGDVAACQRPARLADMLESQRGQRGIVLARPAEFGTRPVQQSGIAALGNPVAAHVGQSGQQVNARGGVGVGTGGVVDRDRGILLNPEAGWRIGLVYFAHRHANIRA